MNKAEPTSVDTTFSAVVATLGRPDQLRVTLTTLMACQPPPTEVLVVDGDEDATASPIVAEFASELVPVRHIRAPRGLTRQRNRALLECGADVVAFFDDDARPAPDVFAFLAPVYLDPAVAGATGLVVEPASNNVGGKESRLRRWLPGGGSEGGFTRYGYPRRLTRPEIAKDIEFMQGCFMTARLETARRVGFDEKLPGYGLAEDEDFSFRLSRLGRIRYVPDAVVYHDNLGFGTRDRRAVGRQVVVNRDYLFRKNFAQTSRARAGFAMLIFVLLLHRVVNRDPQGALGLIDGIREVRRSRS